MAAICQDTFHEQTIEVIAKRWHKNLLFHQLLLLWRSDCHKSDGNLSIQLHRKTVQQISAHSRNPYIITMDECGRGAIVDARECHFIRLPAAMNGCPLDPSLSLSSSPDSSGWLFHSIHLMFAFLCCQHFFLLILIMFIGFEVSFAAISFLFHIHLSRPEFAITFQQLEKEKTISENACYPCSNLNDFSTILGTTFPIYPCRIHSIYLFLVDLYFFNNISVSRWFII